MGNFLKTLGSQRRRVAIEIVRRFEAWRKEEVGVV
jgi:hypothetical protein